MIVSANRLSIKEIILLIPSSTNQTKLVLKISGRNFYVEFFPNKELSIPNPILHLIIYNKQVNTMISFSILDKNSKILFL